MGIPVNIDELINGEMVESTRIEYKSDFNPNPILHSICAFANDIDNIGGGYIVIGVEEDNGSPDLTFEMDAERQYLSVTIPVHPEFITEKTRRDEAYEEKVLAALAGEQLTITELLKTMGYRGISKKLRDTVKEMVDTGRLRTVYEGRSIRYSAIS